jgi:hypothetical protein
MIDRHIADRRRKLAEQQRQAFLESIERSQTRPVSTDLAELKPKEGFDDIAPHTESTPR